MTVKCSSPMPGFNVGEDCCLAFGDHVLEQPTEQCCEHHPKGGVLRDGFGQPAINGQSAVQGAEAGVSPAAPQDGKPDPSIKKQADPDGGAAEAEAGASKGPAAPPEGYCCVMASRSMFLRHDPDCRVWGEGNLHRLYLQRKAERQ